MVDRFRPPASESTHAAQRSRARWVPLAVSGATSAVIAAVTFPYVLVTERASEWGEWVLGPCLFAVVGVGIAGAIAPSWWTPKRTVVITVLAIVLLVGRLAQLAPR